MSKKFFKRMLFSLFLFVGVERFCHIQTKGFSLWKVKGRYPFHSEWETPPIEEKEKKRLRALFLEPFTYIGSGNSCYVFASKDGTAVIKLFKHHHLDAASFPASLWNALLCKQQQISTSKLDRVFKSCQIAMSHLKEETGLLYCQLNPKDLDLGILQIEDPIGVLHKIDPKEISFVVQERGIPLGQIFAKDSHLNRLAVIQKVIQEQRKIEKKGFLDLDPNFLTNFGMTNEKFIKLDIGAFVPRSTEYEQVAIQKRDRAIRNVKRFL